MLITAGTPGHMYLEERQAKCLQKDSSVSHSGLFHVAQLDSIPLIFPLLWLASWTDDSHFLPSCKSAASQSYFRKMPSRQQICLKQEEIPSLHPFPDHKIASQVFLANSLWLRWYPVFLIQFLDSSLTPGNLCNLLPLEAATGSEVTWGSSNWKALKHS